MRQIGRLAPAGLDVDRPRPSRVVTTVDRSRVDPRIVEAGEGLEAIFIEQLFKSMRETVPKNELDLENAATGIYRGLLDGEMARSAARGQGFGLADQVIAYLDSRGYNQGRSTGGTYGRDQGRTISAANGGPGGLASRDAAGGAVGSDRSKNDERGSTGR